MNNGFPIIISLIACFAFGFTYSKYRKFKNLYLKEVSDSTKNIRELTRHMVQLQMQLNKQERIVYEKECIIISLHKQFGFHPANINNCSFLSVFVDKSTFKIIQYPAISISKLGVTFKRGPGDFPIMHWDNLLCKN